MIHRGFIVVWQCVRNAFSERAQEKRGRISVTGRTSNSKYPSDDVGKKIPDD